MAGEGKSKRKQEDEEGSRCSENGEQREKEKSGEKNKNYGEERYLRHRYER